MTRARSGPPLDPRLLRVVPWLRRHLALLAALQVLGALLTVAWAGVLASAIAGVVVDGATARSLTRDLLLVAGFGAARVGVAAAVETVSQRAAVRVTAALRRATVSAVVALGPAWTRRQPPGRVATATGPGLEGIDGLVTRALPAFVAAAVVPAVVTVRIFLADRWSAVVLVALLPLVPVFMVLVGITTKAHVDRRFAVLAVLSGRFLDLVQGLTSLKIYGRASAQVAQVRRATDAYRRHTLATLRIAFLSGLVLDLLATLSVAVVAVEIGLRLDAAHMTLATALVVLLLAPEVFAPLRAIGVQYHAAEEGRAAAGAALDIVAEAEEAAAPTGVDHDPSTATAVSWRGVEVRYEDRGGPVLAAVDLDVAPGSVVVVEGPSGAGKSTLLATALGLVPVTAGRVVLGAGTARPAWVPQRPRPTRPTVGAEVALGDPVANAAAVEHALATCAAPPASTPLGEDGSAVSAGQRRRVALARALLHARAGLARGETPLLLLDEPSEDLDAATEQVVVDLVAALAGRATVVVATHSARLAATADRRIRVEAGRIVRDVVTAPRRDNPAGIAVSRTGTPARPPARRDTGAARSLTRDLLTARGHRRAIAAAGLLSGGAGLAGLALTATSLWLICRAAQHPDLQVLALAVVGVRTFALARALLRYAERLVGHDAALRVLAELRGEVFARLVPLVPSAFGGARRGAVLRGFVADVDATQDGLVRAAVPAVGAAVTAGGAVTLAALLVPAAGAVLAAAVLVGLVMAPALARAVTGPGARAARTAADRDATVLGLVESLDELRVYDAVDATLAEVDDLDRRHTAAARRRAGAAGAAVAVAGVAAAVAVPGVLAIGVAAARGGAISVVTVATLVACVLAAFEALAPLPTAAAAWARVRAATARVAELLTLPVPVSEPLHPATQGRGAPGVSAQELTVAPAPGCAPAVRGLTFDLPAGEVLALMGPSGCGKSTVLAATLRLLTPQDGAVHLTTPGQAAPVLELPGAELPALVAGSLQGDHVFDTSLRDNLRVVRPEASATELDTAAARAGLAGFVRSLPDGWDTPAGPDGAALSGGQRQRLLLARAFLADPAILVLDEPTAHLDAETADAVMADLLTGREHRTVLLSTHRPPAAGVPRLRLTGAPADEPARL